MNPDAARKQQNATIVKKSGPAGNSGMAVLFLLFVLSGDARHARRLAARRLVVSKVSPGTARLRGNRKRGTETGNGSQTSGWKSADGDDPTRG